MVRKFRTIEEMNTAQPVVLETDPARLVARVTELYELAQKLCPGRFKGVHKFRNMDEANQFRLAWMRERATRLAAMASEEA